MALFIADTHSLAWYFTKSRKLGREALQVFRDSTSGEDIGFGLRDQIRWSAISIALAK